MKQLFKRSFFLFFLSLSALAQVSVAPAPPIHMQFLDATGNPLSGGFLYTYAAGTSAAQSTYVDASGFIQNANPIPLDSTGAPSNGSVQVGIYLSNFSYKFVATDANGVLQWTQDNVTGYLGLLNLANTWTFPQTFNSQIVLTPSDNQIVIGSFGNQMTLDFPPPIGNQTLHFPSVSGNIVVGSALCSDANLLTVTANLSSAQVLKTCPFSAGALNATGKSFRLTASVNLIPGGSGPPTSALQFGSGATPLTLFTLIDLLASQGVSSNSWLASAQVICVVRTPGTAGVISCTPIVITSGTSAQTILPGQIILSPIDLTAPFSIGLGCAFSLTSASNTCTQYSQIVEQLN